MTSRFHRVKGAAVVLLTGALIATTAACGSNTQSTDTSQPGVPDKVTAGVIAIVDVAPIYLGKQKGFFTEKNIELTLQTATGGAAIIPLVVARQYDFGFSNVISLLLAQSRNVPVKVVANGNNSTGDPAADFGGLVVKDPAITSPKQLEGKKVATNTLNNIVDTTTKDIVQKAGGDPSKVSFVELPFPDMAGAMDTGKVDAIFVVEPFLSAAKAKGWKQIGAYADVDPKLCVALYFTSQALATSNPELVKRFGEAISKSLEYANAHPDEVRAILSTYTQITEDVRKALVLPKWPTAIDTASITKLGDLAVTYKLLPAKPDLSKLLPT
jgi:NitT/TauT family transport system substrate-binding protein